MMVRMLLVLAVLVVATGLGLWWRARNGRFTPVGASVLEQAQSGSERDDATGHDVLAADEIGAPLGTDATFVQLSSEVCAPCRRARAVLSEIAAERPGLAHVELAVEDHLDLVRRFNVLRTPTVLLLDDRGAVVGRMSGAMSRSQALTALDSCPGAVPGR